MRIIKALKIEEISAVASPAQAGATAKILKSATTEKGAEVTKMDDAVVKAIKMASLDFGIRVKEIRKRDNCTRTEAMSKARIEFPTTYAAMQVVVTDEPAPSVTKADAVLTGFEKQVADIRKRDNCTRTDAMAKARTEAPEAFAAYQAS